MLVNGPGATLVSRAFGSGHPRQARALIFVELVTIVVLWGLTSIFFLPGADLLAKLANSNPEVSSAMIPMLHVIGLMGFLQHPMEIAAGSLRAMAKPRWVAIVQFVSLYVVALPVGCYLAFYCNFGVYGLYTGFIAAAAVGCVTLMGIMTHVDFEHIVDETRTRLKRHSTQTSLKPEGTAKDTDGQS